MEGKRKLAVPAVATLALLGLAGTASAGPISCDVTNASANGSFSDQCSGSDSVGANPGAETTFVNTAFGGDPFMFVDKTGEGSSEEDFVLNVTMGGELDPFHFLYTLKVPDSYVGAVVDWVLLIKQASNSTIAYLFNGVTLGIDGGFNSFWLNPAGKESNDYSHASGLIRESTVPVPEPSTFALALLGLMLAGTQAFRSRRN